MLKETCANKMHDISRINKIPLTDISHIKVKHINKPQTSWKWNCSHCSNIYNASNTLMQNIMLNDKQLTVERQTSQCWKANYSMLNDKQAQTSQCWTANHSMLDEKQVQTSQNWVVNRCKQSNVEWQTSQSWIQTWTCLTLISFSLR